MEEKKSNLERKNKYQQWFKRIGWAGLAFFTIKGLVWLAVIYFGADALEGCVNK